ncbi:MAG: hypothetical protein ACRD5W_14325 [Candidatus Acidiferrales bacterium]
MRPRTLLAMLIAAALLSAACKRSADTKPLDEAGIAYSTIKSFEELEITEDEVAQVVWTHSAGISDRTCLELVKLARSRGVPFADGYSAAKLRAAGMSDEGILELARLNHLGPWAGEGQALLLAGFREETVLELARRRSQGIPTMNSPSLAKLRNEGYSEARILKAIRDGVTDAQVDAAVNPLPSPGGFRRQPRRSR